MRIAARRFSFALLQRLEKNPEGKTQLAVIKESSTEGEGVASRSSEEKDATVRNTITAKSSTGKATVCKRGEPEESSAEKDVDGKEEEVKESSERLERENSATCHVPGGTWLEQRISLLLFPSLPADLRVPLWKEENSGFR
ncbi:hypothetical protein NDU88_005015 [Pleurodeles waltl]|uniref:Uncharacterized protein n=1 Tax=Pleurodeles waltl TaxID=8319 RepID=A0AAV7L2I2_PLEWA|nr:hypothetical protein NDU88_005015 [Pleurodeles waltl]